MDYQRKYLQKNKTLHDEDARSKTDAVVGLVPPTEKIESILDVACGSGDILRLLSKHYKSFHNVGIDISKEIVRIAEKRDKEEIAQWRSKDVFDIETYGFDLVLAIDIIEHVEEDRAFLRKISSFGDFIVIKVPIENNPVNSIVKFLTFGYIDEKKKTEYKYGHIHHYHVDEFLQMIDESSLELLRVNFMPLPKRSSLFWESMRLLLLPLWYISQRLSVKLNGGFLVVLLKGG